MLDGTEVRGKTGASYKTLNTPKKHTLMQFKKNFRVGGVSKNISMLLLPFISFFRVFIIIDPS